jgi:hypothetical protein
MCGGCQDSVSKHCFHSKAHPRQPSPNKVVKCLTTEWTCAEREEYRAASDGSQSQDPLFSVGLYRALYDCYSDNNQWDKIHEMLNEV